MTKKNYYLKEKNTFPAQQVLYIIRAHELCNSHGMPDATARFVSS
jgi:hypothetical protein